MSILASSAKMKSKWFHIAEIYIEICLYGKVGVLLIPIFFNSAIIFDNCMWMLSHVIWQNYSLY